MSRRRTKGLGGSTGKAIFSLCSMRSSPGIVVDKLKKLNGVKDATLNVPTNTVLVYYDPGQLGNQDLRMFLRRIG